MVRDMPGLRPRPLRVSAESTASSELSISLAEKDIASAGSAGVEGFIRYASEVFDQAAAELIARRLVRVMRQVVTDPGLRLGQVDVLDPAERRLVVEAWNATEMAIPDDTLAAMLVAQAASSPEATAVICGQASVSYAELDAAANRLARYLIERGVGPEHTVALAVPRSQELVVALLAVVKAGGATLLVDPHQPADITRSMLAEARPATTLCTLQTAGMIPAENLPSRVVLDVPATVRAIDSLTDSSLARGGPAAPLLSAHAACAIYKSEHVQTPSRLVMVDHKPIVNQVKYYAKAYPEVRETTLLDSRAPLNLLLIPAFATLCSGGCIQFSGPGTGLPARPCHGEPDAKALLPASPSLLEEISGRQEPGSPDVVPVVTMMAGHPLHPDLAQKWRGHRLGAVLVSRYGPAETAGGCADYRMAAQDLLPEAVVPAGRPIWNMRVFALDDYLQPVPPGVIGEIYAAGECLARGYLDQPKLTSERLVACPFGPPGTRMFRSGDLGTWGADGVLAVLGDADAAGKAAERKGGARRSRRRGDFDPVLRLSAGTQEDRTLFCVHPSVGLSWSYAALAEHLPPMYPLYGLQARGLAGGQTLPQTMQEMCDDYIDRIRSIQPSGPYFLLGWSFGGNVAHAIATRLQEEGQEIRLLALLDAYPGRAGEDSGYFSGEDASANQSAPMRQELEGVAQFFGQGGGQDAMANIQRVMANNGRLGAQFIPQTFTGDVLLFVAMADRPAALPAQQAMDSWKPYVQGRVVSRQIDCEHYGMMQPKPLGEIGQVISEWLQRDEETVGAGDGQSIRK